MSDKQIVEPTGTPLEIDLSELDLNALDALESTALGNILRELNEEHHDVAGHSNHSSHTAHSAHGTAAW